MPEKSKQINLREIGIDAYAQVFDTGGNLRLLVSKPSGQEWMTLSPHDFIIPIRCPKCESTETEPTFDGGMYCHACESFFTP